MSADSASNEPNQIWNRILLLNDLHDIVAQNLSQAAIHITDQHDALTVLAGTVKPFETEEHTYYKNLGTFIVCRTTFEGRQRFALTFGQMFAARLDSYDYTENPDHFGRLSREDTQADRLHRHKLERTQFDLIRSQKFEQILFGPPGVLYTNWHTTLGVELAKRPKELEQ